MIHLSFQRICRLALIVVAIAAFAYVLAADASHSKFREFASPDGRFEVIVYRSRQWFGTTPGNSSDAPGNVCLYETATGKLLRRKHVEMVQLVERVVWSATNVEIRLIADWRLP